MADRAACRRTKESVVAGDMAGGAADNGTFDTAFGIGRHGGERKRQSQSAKHACRNEYRFHWIELPFRSFNPSASHWFRRRDLSLRLRLGAGWRWRGRRTL